MTRKTAEKRCQWPMNDRWLSFIIVILIPNCAVWKYVRTIPEAAEREAQSEAKGHFCKVGRSVETSDLLQPLFSPKKNHTNSHTCMNMNINMNFPALSPENIMNVSKFDLDAAAHALTDLSRRCSDLSSVNTKLSKGGSTSSEQDERTKESQLTGIESMVDNQKVISFPMKVSLYCAWHWSGSSLFIIPRIPIANKKFYVSAAL